MFRKLLFAGALSLLACASVRATDVAVISFNFSSDGVIVLEGKAPAGVTICPKIRFHNPKLRGYAFPLEINLDKTKSVNLTFKVKGGSGKMVTSTNCRAFSGKKKLPAPTLKCTEFVLDDEEVATPFTIKKWKAVKTIEHLEDGDTFTVKATFESTK